MRVCVCVCVCVTAHFTTWTSSEDVRVVKCSSMKSNRWQVPTKKHTGEFNTVFEAVYHDELNLPDYIFNASESTLKIKCLFYP